jgi:hypothetical protein
VDEGAALDRIMGLSTGAKVASVDAPEFLTITGVAITAAEAAIATVPMISIVKDDIVFPAVAAIAIVLAPLAADVPVERAALTAID